MYRADQERSTAGRVAMDRREASRTLHGRARQGVTLIELLIVVVILIMVVSIAIPLVRFNFSDRKVRESARQLNAYFALAKTLAAERNRQVGVMFERTTGDLNRCQSIYIIEVPAPYSGDVLDARAYVRKNPALNTAIYDTNWQVIFDTVEIPSGVSSLKCAMLTHSRALVNVGDTFLIRFNHRGEVYLVKRFQINATPSQDIFVMQDNPSPPSPVPIPGCWMPADRDAMTGTYDFNLRGWGRTGVDDDGAHGVDDESEQGIPVFGSTTPPLDASDYPIGLPFQIYFSPKRTQAQPLDLPNGVAVDLAWSGLGASGTEFDSLSGSVGDQAKALPVGVLFTPGGQIERIYPGNGAFTSGTSTVHFLIGSPETIQPVSTGTLVTAVNPRDGNDKNLENQAHLWVSVGPVNASVTTAENFYDSAVGTVADCRRFARSAQTKGGR